MLIGSRNGEAGYLDEVLLLWVLLGQISETERVSEQVTEITEQQITTIFRLQLIMWGICLPRKVPGQVPG